MSGTRVLVIGAGGNLGRRLVARGLEHGHRVTAFVRSAARFAEAAPDAAGRVRIVEGDAREGPALGEAMAEADAAVNVSGNVFDGAPFSTLFAAVLAAAERHLPAPRRFWALAGAAVLDIPRRGGIGLDLPFVPRTYAPHATNWRALEASGLDWSLMCPGPLVPAPNGRTRPDLRVSVDMLPYAVPGWAAWAPAPAVSLLMKRRMPELTVAYEDVAEIIMSNLGPGGPFSRRRVGVALPAGEHAEKSGWTAGTRGADG